MSAAEHNKQDKRQKKHFGGKFFFFLSLVPLEPTFHCLRLLFFTLLIERCHQRLLTLNAALEYEGLNGWVLPSLSLGFCLYNRATRQDTQKVQGLTSDLETLTFAKPLSLITHL